ncbi:MAG: hypothetical protein JOZ96_20000 [Acidobacteria bacterium]|nr:hypothetical protein [Acidobacteriota bacterium]
MREVERIVIPLSKGTRVKSLCWHGDELVDWVGGAKRYRLDGTFVEPRISWGYRFDRAVALPDCEYVVIYESLGTKGLLIRNGRLLRELNRSFYHAEAYEYPVALSRLADGRAVIAHCPEEYCKIEIEEVETGRRLTARENKPADFFHSRLQFSPGGRYLLSAGWVWHPFDTGEVYDVERALAEPKSLDEIWHLKIEGVHGELHAAAFNGPDTFVFAADAEIEQSPLVGVYDLTEGRLVSLSPVAEQVGTLMPLGEFAVGFFDHPKLFELKTGQVVQRWDELASGRENSSIIWHQETPTPALALDPANGRFAVAGAEAITVVRLG